MENMKICFMGTPSFAAQSLTALLKNNYSIAAVYTKSPSPSGRGQKTLKTAVHILAEQHNIPVFTPKSLKTLDAQQEFINQNFDICVVASYGLILPKAILDAPKYGCINVHASLLPKLRGASPIQQAIILAPQLNNTTGITIMQMDTGLDTGDILLQDSMEITKETTFTTLHDSLAIIGAKLLIKSLDMIKHNKVIPIKQKDNEASLTKIIKKGDGKINFQEDASLIERKIRAFNPFPSTYFLYNDEIIKVKQAKAVHETHNNQIGEVISTCPLKVACGGNTLQLEILQRQGKKALSAEEILRGFKINIGDILL